MDIEKHDKNKNKDDKNKDKDKEKEKTSNTKLRVDTIKNKAKFSEIVSRLAVLARSIRAGLKNCRPGWFRKASRRPSRLGFRSGRSRPGPRLTRRAKN